MKTDPYDQRQNNCSQPNALLSDNVGIARRSSARSLQSPFCALYSNCTTIRIQWAKMAIFNLYRAYVKISRKRYKRPLLLLTINRTYRLLMGTIDGLGDLNLS